MPSRSSPSVPPKPIPKPAQELVARIVDCLNSDEPTLTRFLQATGLQPKTMRESAQSPLFMLSTLESVAKDEQLLCAFGELEQITPEMIELARTALALEIAIQTTKPSDAEASAINAKVQEQLGKLLRRSKRNCGKRRP